MDKISHSQLVNDALVYLCSHPRYKIRAWKQIVGTFETEWGSKVKVGVPGMADIGGIIYPGKILQVECKVLRDKQRERQIAWEAMIHELGGIYILARSIEDVERGLSVS